jgi:hypothetical protein
MRFEVKLVLARRALVKDEARGGFGITDHWGGKV